MKNFIVLLFHKIQKALNSKAFIWILALIIIQLLGYAIYRERHILRTFNWEFRWQYLLLAAIFHILALALMQLNWHLMIKFFKASQQWMKDFSIYAISLASRRIPTPLLYIGGRFYLYPSEITKPQVIALSTSLEITLIGLAGIIFYILVLPFYSIIPAPFPSELVMAISLIALLILFLFPNLYKNSLNLLLRKISKEPLEVNLSKKSIFLWLFIYILVWLVDGIALHFIASALIANMIILPDTLGISTLASLVGFMGQFLPVGFGLKELTYSALYNRWYPLGVGVVIAITYRVLLTLIEIFWAWLWKHLLAKKITQ